MKKYHITLSLMLIILLTISILTSTYLNSKNKKAEESHAMVQGGAASIVFSPQTRTMYPNEVVSMDVYLNSGGQVISSLALRITYPYSGTTPELDVVDLSGNPSNTIAADSNFLNSGDWSFPIKSVTRANGKVTIDIAAVDTNVGGYSTTTNQKMATIYLKANRVTTTNPITFTIDSGQSQIMTKINPTDILGTATAPQITIKTDSDAPSAIADLSVSANAANSITLGWTAPTDQGPEGYAQSYDLRYSTSQITASNFSSATQVSGEPTPANPGTQQQMTVSGLQAGATYHFAIKSADLAGNTSQISNVVSSQTSSSTLSFGFKMQSISNTGIHKNITVTLKNGQTEETYSAAFTSSSSGVFTPDTPITLSNISTNGTTYEVYAKDISHLRKKLGSIQVNPGSNSTTSWNSQVLLGGDFDSNNVINIIDLGKILSTYTALSIQVNSSNTVYDVDANNVINISDVASTLANYTQLEVLGD